jgi:uncharacterized protein
MMDIQIPVINPVQRYNFDVTKFDDSNRTIDFVFTTSDKDRSNDIVNPSGAIIEDYMKNPVFLWSHDKTRQPLGKINNLILNNGRLEGTVEFWRNDIDPTYWSEADKMAVSVYEQYKNGFLKAVSISFIPVDYSFNKITGGNDYKTYKITEISAVTVPDNPNALKVGKGIDSSDIIDSIKAKLILKTIKERI